jgi:hypothetical protein
MITSPSRRSAFFVLIFLAMFLVATGYGQTIRTPPPGSAERKAIMDQIRVPCEKDLKQKVVFKVDLLKISGEWAAARVTPVRPDGGQIDYRKTKYKEAFEADAFESNGEAFLRKMNGMWKLLHWRFGGTDTELIEWVREAGAPEAIAEVD